MTPDDHPALQAFRRAARRVPAYRSVLREAQVRPREVGNMQDFTRLPILDKSNTFKRFPIEELCLDGKVGMLDSILTSSGHTGVFSFGLGDRRGAERTIFAIDDFLDLIFAVRSRRTLLINCLPMGVKVPTRSCALAETSVRADMAVGLVQGFARHFEQFILVGETAFIKNVLELGVERGIEWPGLRVQVIVGEEPLAENARKYIEGMLGMDLQSDAGGLMFSSMGIGEVGLNLFHEIPLPSPGNPTAFHPRALIRLRRLLHDNLSLRQQILGTVPFVPSLFTYEPGRIHVEFETTGRLLLTTLDSRLRLPLIRYSSGDYGAFVTFPLSVRTALESAGIPWDWLEELPIVAISGRGHHALAGTSRVYPESVKEAIYHDPELARLTTANFRIESGKERALIRIQLKRNARGTDRTGQEFAEVLGHYITGLYDVRCESYDQFVNGMALDYERKFNYLGD